MLNLTRLHLGIAHESQFQGLGIITGIIHVGANLGQERELYAKYKLKVLWIEPLPHFFEKLRENIREFPDQIAPTAALRGDT
jgi:hypothetical protein